MKYLAIILSIFIIPLSIMCVSGCAAKQPSVVTTTMDGKVTKELKLDYGFGGGVSSHTISEFEYDGCEYVAFGVGNTLAVTHKGNCKYCQQRNK